MEEMFGLKQEKKVSKIIEMIVDEEKQNRIEMVYQIVRYMDNYNEPSEDDNSPLDNE